MVPPRQRPTIESKDILGLPRRAWKKLRSIWRPAESPMRYADVTADENRTLSKVRPYTMTSPESIVSLIRSVEYVLEYKIPGAFVECGVWRGGSSLAIAETLVRHKADRDLYLFDTYEGMPKPSEPDQDFRGVAADGKWERLKTNCGSEWCRAGLSDVRDTMALSEYPVTRMHFVVGKVEETLPASAPPEIALLRLDTDWYESTRHEMIHLFPRLAQGGILIVDDYGYWQGSRRAIDEFFTNNGIRMLLARIDYTVRLGVKA